MKQPNDNLKTNMRAIRTERQRKAFAPLEMTLVLPFLMLMMAAIMAFGINACWKLRTESVARDVTWRNRHPHSGNWNANRDVQNPEWTSEAEDNGRNQIVRTSASGGSQLTVFDDDEVLNAQIIRGDIRNINVNSNLLNFSRGVQKGVARIKREPTILPVMGMVDFDTEHQFLGDVFQYGQMLGSGLARGRRYSIYQTGNVTRRFPRIYRTDLDTLYDLPGIQNAISAIDAVRDPSCLAIDEDQEFFDFYRSWCWVPDFHARIPSFTSTDREYVKTEIVEPFIENSVPRVPRRMVNGTIRLYREMQEVAPTQQEYDRLEALIEELKTYRSSLD